MAVAVAQSQLEVKYPQGAARTCQYLHVLRSDQMVEAVASVKL